MAHVRTIEKKNGEWQRVPKHKLDTGYKPTGQLRYQVAYRGPDGKERFKNFARKIDARQFVHGVETKKANREWIDPKLARGTLASFIKDHFQPTTLGLAESTRDRDESYIRTHIIPALGSMPVSSIDYAVCQAWVNGMTTKRKGTVVAAAPATTVKAAQILGKVLRTAVRARWINYNPMTDVELPSVDDPDDIYLTPAQVEQLADATTNLTMKGRPDARPGARYRALVWMGCYSGGRIGELLALRWTDVNFLKRTVTFERKVLELSGRGLVEGRTKTRAGRRQVTLPRRVITELEAHQVAYGGSELIFTGAQGAQVRANQLRQRQWAKAVKAAGLDSVELPSGTARGLKLHDMRHTAVSLWVAAGATDMEVAKWAGHTSAAFTKSRYAHLFPEHGEALAEKLDAFIDSATTMPAALRVIS